MQILESPVQRAGDKSTKQATKPCKGVTRLCAIHFLALYAKGSALSALKNHVTIPPRALPMGYRMVAPLVRLRAKECHHATFRLLQHPQILMRGSLLPHRHGHNPGGVDGFLGCGDSRVASLRPGNPRLCDATPVVLERVCGMFWPG